MMSTVILWHTPPDHGAALLCTAGRRGFYKAAVPRWWPGGTARCGHGEVWARRGHSEAWVLHSHPHPSCAEPREASSGLSAPLRRDPVFQHSMRSEDQALFPVGTLPVLLQDQQGEIYFKSGERTFSRFTNCSMFTKF